MRNTLRHSQRWVALVVGLALCTAPQGHAQSGYGTEIVPLAPHNDMIRGVWLSPDGRTFVTSSRDQTTKVWDLESQRLVRTLDDRALGLAGVPAVGPDARQMAAVHEDGSLRLFALDSGHLVRTIGGGFGERDQLAMTPEGREIVLSRQDGLFDLWDLRNGTRIRQFGDAGAKVHNMLVLPDGRSLLAGYEGGTVRQWSLPGGQLLRTFAVHDLPRQVTKLAVTPDGRTFVSRAQTTVKTWDLQTGQHRRTMSPVNFGPGGLVIDPRGRSVFVDAPLASQSDWTKDESTIEVRDIETGAHVRRIAASRGLGDSFAITADGARLIQGSVYGEITIRSTSTGDRIGSISGFGIAASDVAMTADGRHFVVLLSNGVLQLWDLESGSLVRSFNAADSVNTCSAASGALKVRGRHLACAGATRPFPLLWDIETGRFVRAFGEGQRASDPDVELWSGITEITLDGRYILAAFSPRKGGGAMGTSHPRKYAVEQWELATGRLVRVFDHPEPVAAIVVSPDGQHMVSHAGGLRLWRVSDGALLRSGAKGLTYGLPLAIVDQTVRTGNAALDLQTLEPAWLLGPEAPVEITALTPDGRRGVGIGWRSRWRLELFDAEKGRHLRSFSGLPLSLRAEVGRAALSPDGKRIVVAGAPLGLGIWDAETGAQIAMTYFGRPRTSEPAEPQPPAGRTTEWLVMTPEGFFSASSPGAAPLLSVVRGPRPYGVDQMWQSLFAPDLVREKLAGDQEKEVEKAAAQVSLDKVLDSAPAPRVVITSHTDGAQSRADIVPLVALITDQGKGVGRIEWRVNGITVAVAERPEGGGPAYAVARRLALDPGDNVIEVIAYNASNLLASLPARTTVKFTGPADKAKPTLHILAIGIDTYVDASFAPPLDLAEKDAAAFADTMRKASAGLYGQVRVTPALGKNATRANLEKIIHKLAAEIHLRDTFILFAAGHGVASNGRFYLIPQDYQSGGAGSLATGAIGQDQLQDWLANRIKAKRAIILLDTCESGALVAGHARSRVSGPASEAAVGRLHEATGRPVLTAAAAGQFANEGLISASGEQRGVFTWAVLDALRMGDTNGNGLIELSELVAHVQRVVPKVAAEMGGTGRAATSDPLSDRQTARFGSRGEDLVVARRLQ